MKTILILPLLVVASFLQAQDREALLNELSDGTCTCITEAEPSVEQLEVTIGLCVFQAGSNKMDQIESVLGYSLTDESDMTALGEELGRRLATSCPGFLALIMEAMEEGELDPFLNEQADVPPPPPPGSERWSDIEPGADRLGEPDGEEWIDIDRPAEEEEFGNGPSIAAEPEVFPPTEEEWSDIDRPAEEEQFGNGPSSSAEPEEFFPPTEEEWSDIDRPAEEEQFGNGPSSDFEEEFPPVEEEWIDVPDEVFPPTEEEWSDIDRPAEEEEFGNGPSAAPEPEIFPPTEEEWLDIDRPASEEPFGNGGNFDDVPDFEDFGEPEEFFPPTEEEWLDIDRPADEESFGNGPSENVGESGMAEREFVTEPMPNTNTSGLRNATVSGKIRRINSGLVSEIVLRADDRQEHTLLLSGDVPGAQLLQRRAEVTITYREVERYDSRTGNNVIVKEIISVE